MTRVKEKAPKTKYHNEMVAEKLHSRAAIFNKAKEMSCKIMTFLTLC